MPRGYRRYVIAALGWLILAASPPGHQAHQPQADADRAIGNSLKEISATLKDAQKPSVHDQPCDEGNDNRDSDLCAQWKAADAAKLAAGSASFGNGVALFSAIIGLLTLVAAGLAAKFAKDAADHTKTGASEAKRAADAAERGLAQAETEMRPTLVAKGEKLVRVTPDGREFMLEYMVVNTGQTPAHGLYMNVQAHFEGPRGSRREISGFVPIARIGTVARDGDVAFRDTMTLTKTQLRQMQSGKGQVVISFSVPFFDEFGGHWIFEHTMGADERTLTTQELYTADCRQSRYDPPKEKQAQESAEAPQELPLEGGGSGKAAEPGRHG